MILIGDRPWEKLCDLLNLTISGGFANTCKNIGLSGVSLQGDCKTFNGDFRFTRLNLNGVISNNDGNLTFDR